MQAYGEGFARVYNAKWAGFAKQVASRIINFYNSTPIGQNNKAVLDLCCGAGHLSVLLLEQGYSVVGVDLSEHMLRYAKENACRYLTSGQARFIQGDASDFVMDERFGLVVSTYDSLNHLPDEQALVKCFQCVHTVCDGYFIFDLNTVHGLRNWNGIRVDEGQDDAVIITRGIYDEQGNRAWMRISGFMQRPDGLFERFAETVYNTVYEFSRVKQALRDVGFGSVHFARMQDLAVAIDEPEKEGRVMVVAER